MRPTRSFVALACLASALVACRDRSVATPAPRAGDGDSALDGAADATDAMAANDGDASRRGPDEAIDMDGYFSLKQREDDVQNAYRATYEAMTTGPLASLTDAVVLCRAGVVEPAPLPTSTWDRTNGRDLMFEVVVDDSVFRHAEGPLGSPSFHVRVDDVVRSATTGRRVRWVLRDRDQAMAYPYTSSIVVGTIDLTNNVKVPFRLSKPTFDVDCRGMPTMDAARVLLPVADRALAEAEAKTAWTPADPRGTFSLRVDLGNAADQIRIGSVIARSARRTEEWAQREERLRAIVRTYLASAREANAKIDPVPVGVWARVGNTLSARVGDYVCPAVPRGADPGTLNDDQRTGCGLVIELKSPAKLRWEANPWGPAYACRMTNSAFDIDIIEGPARSNGVCILGFRRGPRWLKGQVELSPTEPTIAVLGGTTFGQAIRLKIGEASALLATPSLPDR